MEVRIGRIILVDCQWNTKSLVKFLELEGLANQEPNSASRKNSVEFSTYVSLSLPAESTLIFY